MTVLEIPSPVTACFEGAEGALKARIAALEEAHARELENLKAAYELKM